MPDIDLQRIEGVVENVVFRSEASGFTVLEVALGEDRLVTVVGELPMIDVGEEICATGSYTSHPTYGQQFKALAVERKLPATAGAIFRYLSGGAIHGIGPVIARRMVDAFGDDTLSVIEESPSKLSQIRGISAQKAEDIGIEYKRISGVRSAMLFLSKFGIGAAMSISVWKRFGQATQQEVTKDPYLLCNEDIGLGFPAADSMAETLGISTDAVCRMRGGINFVLCHNLSNGHSCLPEGKLAMAASSLLELDKDKLQEEIAAMCGDGYLLSDGFGGTRYIYLPQYYNAETYVAGRIKMMLQLANPGQSAADGEIDALEKELGIHYASLQRKAISAAVTGNLLILTGGPGTGKTTALNGIIHLCERRKLRVALAAPTGRAAKRISEISGREAKTIHRLLEVDFGDDRGFPKFKRNDKNPLPYDVVIIDEMSMVDLRLFEALIRAVRLGSTLIMVGDPDQLPPVGAGNLLGELIASGMIETVHLNEVFRQAAESQIVMAAHQIVSGQVPDLTRKNSDLFFMPRSSIEQAMQTVVELVKDRLPAAYQFNPMQDIQVISPSRQGGIGTTELNRMLQAALNPPSPQKVDYQAATLFREGDKVMQIKNNYDIPWTRDEGDEGAGIFNGDIGLIDLIDRPSRSVLVRFDDRIAQYTFDNLDELELAYAITVHKSQGSEFDAVIIPAMGYHQKLHYRNLLYTGVTRAKKLLIIVGQIQTVARMVENNRKALRYTNLSAMLQEES